MRSDEKSRTRSMGIYFRFEKILGSFGQRSGNQFRIVWKLIEIESMITGGRRGSARGRGGIERERRDRTMILSEPPRSERIEGKLLQFIQCQSGMAARGIGLYRAITIISIATRHGSGTIICIGKAYSVSITLAFARATRSRQTIRK